MKRLKITSPLILCALFAAGSTAQAFECKVCHSKNPAMVKMHKAVQATEIGCFDCHKVGEKLMGKSQPKDLASLLKRRASEPICAQCHK